jgi:glycine C-acetyltransferase
MQKEDLAILDMAVHASVHEGCAFTNKKHFRTIIWNLWNTF